MKDYYPLNVNACVDKTKAVKTRFNNEKNFISECSEKATELFSDAIILENIEGEDFKVIFDGKEVSVVADNNSDKIYNLLKTKYIRNYSKIVQSFNQVPFIIYGTYVSSVNQKNIYYIGCNDEPLLVFYDIYINDNWVCHDHLLELIKKNNLEYPPILLKGKSNFSEAKKLANNHSLFSKFLNQKIKGVIIKAAIENNKDNRRTVSKITNDEFKPKKIEKLFIEDIDADAKKILNDVINNYTIINWIRILSECNIVISKTNISKIMRTLWRETEIDVEIELTNYKGKFKEKIIKNKIKKLFPNIVREKLNII